MEVRPLDVSEYRGGYIAEVGNGEVLSDVSIEALEAQLRQRGYDEANLPVLESVPDRGNHLF
jgi:hypothetical protein